jgi:hypothetical protein
VGSQNDVKKAVKYYSVSRRANGELVRAPIAAICRARKKSDLLLLTRASINLLLSS